MAPRSWLRIPMMPISQSDLMPIGSEASNAGLSQCELVIGIRQGFSRVGLVDQSIFGVVGARRATDHPQKSPGPAGRLASLFRPSRCLALRPRAPFPSQLPERFSVKLKPMRRMDQSIQNAVSHRRIADLPMPLGHR